MRKIKGCDWSRWLCWVRGSGWLDSTSSASAGGKDADPTFSTLVWWWGRRPYAAGRGNGFLSFGLSLGTVLDLCHCLPPDRTNHKVNDPKVDYCGGWGMGRSGSSRDSNPAGLYWSSSPTQNWEPFGLESVLNCEHCAELNPRRRVGICCSISVHRKIYNIFYLVVIILSPKG